MKNNVQQPHLYFSTVLFKTKKLRPYTKNVLTALRFQKYVFYIIIRAGFILFFLGAFLGPIGDYCHVVSHTTAYPKEVYRFYFFDTIPFWVPFLFGSASLFIGITHPMSDRLLLRRSRRRFGVKRKCFAYMGAFLFLGSYCLSGFVPSPHVVLASLAFITWFMLDRTWEGILYGVVTAFIGTVFEIYLVQNKIFWYEPHASALFGVATWLPWLYFIASITVGNIGRMLLR